MRLHLSRSALQRSKKKLFGTLAAVVIAVSGLGLLAAAPASAATKAPTAITMPVATTAHDSTAQPARPDSVWLVYNAWYPTRLACAQKGVQFVVSGVAFTYQCLEINRGYYFTWELLLLE
jgi:hypothetical protein